MQDQETSKLTTILSEVLANLAFVCADDQGVDPPAGERWLATTIRYKGPVAGSLRLICTRGFAVQVAAILLGIDPSDDLARQESDDAVKEFMNILCGQLVTAVHGTEDVYNLTIPEVVELSAVPEFGTRCETPAEESLLSVNGEPVQLFHVPETGTSQA